jgi:hypothetical protein
MHGRYLFEVRLPLHTTHPMMRFAFMGLTTAYRLRRYHPDGWSMEDAPGRGIGVVGAVAEVVDEAEG